MCQAKNHRKVKLVLLQVVATRTEQDREQLLLIFQVRSVFLILAAIHADLASSPRSASSLSHNSSGRLILDVVTVRPVGFLPAPFRAPPLAGFISDIPGRWFRLGESRCGRLCAPSCLVFRSMAQRSLLGRSP